MKFLNLNINRFKEFIILPGLCKLDNLGQLGKLGRKLDKYAK